MTMARTLSRRCSRQAAGLAVSVAFVHADIKAGQGAYYSSTTKLFWAVTCTADNYGAPEETNLADAQSCRDCQVTPCGTVAGHTHAVGRRLEG